MTCRAPYSTCHSKCANTIVANDSMVKCTYKEWPQLPALSAKTKAQLEAQREHERAGGQVSIES